MTSNHSKKLVKLEAPIAYKVIRTSHSITSYHLSTMTSHRINNSAFSRSMIMSNMDQPNTHITSTPKGITYTNTNCHAGTRFGEAIWQEYGCYAVKL